MSLRVAQGLEMSFTDIIKKERNLEPEEIEKALLKTIDIIRSDEDVSAIVMYAIPTDDPEHSMVELYVHSEHPLLVGEMIALLQEWRTENIPKPGAAN